MIGSVIRAPLGPQSALVRSAPGACSTDWLTHAKGGDGLSNARLVRATIEEQPRFARHTDAVEFSSQFTSCAAVQLIVLAPSGPRRDSGINYCCQL